MSEPCDVNAQECENRRLSDQIAFFNMMQQRSVTSQGLLVLPAGFRVHSCSCRSSHSHARRSVAFPVRNTVNVRRTHLSTVTVQAGPAGLSENDKVGLRSEAEAPFRVFRLVFYSFFFVSASIGTLLALTQLVGDIGRGRPPATSLQNVGIDVAAAALFGWLGSRDWKARETQMARLRREESLGSLQVELANRKRVTLSNLRSFSRVVIVAGTPQQVQDAIQQAEPLRKDLLARGILIVPLPIYKAEGDSVHLQLPEGSAEEEQLKWRARALQEDRWRDWFTEQMKLAGASPDRGLYVGLRMDGRVRASGAGSPPWQAFVAQIPPLEGKGAWTGFFDVFDGRI